MVKVDEKSNAQSWELEVACKNKKYLDAVINAILETKFLEFEVNIVEVVDNSDEDYDAKYTVLIWCCWFNNLYQIVKKLRKIESRFE